jgi:hypothetical protein
LEHSIILISFFFVLGKGSEVQNLAGILPQKPGEDGHGDRAGGYRQQDINVAAEKEGKDP